MSPRIAGLFHQAAGVVKDQRGITGLETAIVLIALVLVAVVVFFVIVNTGLLSSEQSERVVLDPAKPGDTPTPDIQRTVAAAVRATIQAIPTPTAVPAATLARTALPGQSPAVTTTPGEVSTPTLLPTATPTPTPSAKVSNDPAVEPAGPQREARFQIGDVLFLTMGSGDAQRQFPVAVVEVYTVGDEGSPSWEYQVRWPDGLLRVQEILLSPKVK